MLMGFFLTATLVAKANEVSIQPGPIEGVDAYFDNINTTSCVDNEYLRVSRINNTVYASVIRFETSNLPEADMAMIWLYTLDPGNNHPVDSMNIYLPVYSWDETTASWDSQRYGNLLEVNTSGFPAFPGGWYRFDVTSIYDGWRRGLAVNNGVVLAPEFISSDVSNLFASSDYPDPTLRPKLILFYPGRLPLTFPLEDLSPYNTRTVAVFDNDSRKSQVVAYNGETGSVLPYFYGSGKDRVAGYRKVDGTDFVLDLIREYDDQISNSGRSYLFYDNHTGYDYPMPVWTPIIAVADGILGVDIDNRAPDGINLWRNRAVCPTLKGGRPEWDKYHTFYIVHDRLGYPNTYYQTGYSTWYLHAIDLDPGVMSDIIQDGYARVWRGSTVAYVGDFGAAGSFHLHFGVRFDKRLIDPYGTGASDTTNEDILWDIRP